MAKKRSRSRRSRNRYGDVADLAALEEMIGGTSYVAMGKDLAIGGAGALLGFSVAHYADKIGFYRDLNPYVKAGALAVAGAAAAIGLRRFQPTVAAGLGIGLVGVAAWSVASKFLGVSAAFTGTPVTGYFGTTSQEQALLAGASAQEQALLADPQLSPVEELGDTQVTDVSDTFAYTGDDDDDDVLASIASLAA